MQRRSFLASILAAVMAPAFAAREPAAVPVCTGDEVWFADNAGKMHRLYADKTGLLLGATPSGLIYKN